MTLTSLFTHPVVLSDDGGIRVVFEQVLDNLLLPKQQYTSVKHDRIDSVIRFAWGKTSSHGRQLNGV